MATFTYSFDLNATLKSVFLTDDVAGTTTVQIVNKNTQAVVAQFDIAIFEGLARNYGEWKALRTANDLVSFTKV